MRWLWHPFPLLLLLLNWLVVRRDELLVLFWGNKGGSFSQRNEKLRTVADKCIISHSLDKHNNNSNNQQICKTMSHFTRTETEGPSIKLVCGQIGVQDLFLSVTLCCSVYLKGFITVLLPCNIIWLITLADKSGQRGGWGTGSKKGCLVSVLSFIY